MAERKTILAIDDNVVVLKVLTNLLSPDFDVLTSTSASSAMVEMDKKQPDLILLDIEMPDVSGLEFLHTIRKNPRFIKTPIVVVTGHTDSELVTRAERSGASGIVYKPIDQEDLLKKITYAFEHPPKSIFGL